ncbi:MAG: acyltransferase [Propionibacteriaceae bacterium]|jgi:surface polysaccharide O-acyltransferase-like enzyme|nr:acyltransferase [Propionibacteriaceae bacterium]
MEQRNHLIDFARVFSMVIVVTFHSLLYSITDDGGKISVIPWGPGPWLWIVSWGLAIIPIFFVAAGYANAVVVQHGRDRGETYFEFLALRGGKLLGPLTLFTIVYIVVSSVPAWFGLESEALSKQFAMLLWFLVVYLGLLAASPLLVRAHERFHGFEMLPFLALTIVTDSLAALWQNPNLLWLNLAFVWPLAHQWGIAYYYGWFRTWRIRWQALLALASAGMIAVLVFGFGYPSTAVGFADQPQNNLLPPTTAAIAMGLMQTCVLGILQRLGVAKTLSEKASYRLRVANALALSTYLWHIPMIVLSAAICAALALAFPAIGPVVLSKVFWTLATWALVLTIVPLIARFELRFIPKQGIPRPWLVCFGYGLVFVGVFEMWQHGAVFHYESLASSLADILVLSGIVVSRHAAVEEESTSAAAA